MAKATKPVEVNVENREILPYGREAMEQAVKKIRDQNKTRVMPKDLI
jgi:hypothetical protein